MRKPRSNLLLYLLLNIIVSAATTLGVLMVWDALRKAETPVFAPPQVQGLASGAVVGEGTAQPAAEIPTDAPTAEPTGTLPPPDQPVIEIVSVVGAGDLNQEVVLLKRVGEGNVPMPGWKLAADGGSEFTFPSQPELILYKDGAVQVYSRTGDDTATEVYWDRSTPAWKNGDTLRLLDADGKERAVYQVP